MDLEPTLQSNSEHRLGQDSIVSILENQPKLEPDTFDKPNLLNQNQDIRKDIFVEKESINSDLSERCESTGAPNWYEGFVTRRKSVLVVVNL